MKEITMPPVIDRKGNQWVVTATYIEGIGDGDGPLDDWMNWLAEKSGVPIHNPMWMSVRCERQKP